MTEGRRQILNLLAQGKITAEEADRLIAALEKDSASGGPSRSTEESTPKTKPKYLRIMVEAEEGHAGAGTNPTKVNIRVPMQLLRAGVKLVSLIPAQARNHVNDALRENGIPVDLSQIKPENLEELIDQLNDFTVDVDEKSNKVRIFCE